jgi:hypothetical protein
LKSERINKLFAVFAMFALCAMVLPQMGILTIMDATASENPTTEWTQTYGVTLSDVLQDSVETSDGGFALVGYTNAFGAGDYDFWLIKTDASGNAQWNKTYGGFDTEKPYALIETSDGGFAMVGYTETWGAGDDDAWLVRTDANGVVLWNKTYGGIEDEQGKDLVETSDGGFAIVGYTETWTVGDDDAWLVRTDANGNAQWNMSYGGVEDEKGLAIITTSDGGFAFSGTTETWTVGRRDCWLVRTDASGSAQWNMSHGDIQNDVGSDLVEADDGGFVVVGTICDSTYSLDSVLVKADASGNFLWAKTYGVSSNEDELVKMVKTVDGGYALAGYTSSYGAGGMDVWLVETDASGNVLWNQTWGGTEIDFSQSLVATSDGGYLLGCVTNSFGDPSDRDFWLVKVAVDHPVVSSADVGVLVDYGDGTYDYSTVTLDAATGMTAYNATQVATSSLGASWGSLGAYVYEINGVSAPGSGYWALYNWKYDYTEPVIESSHWWEYSEVGCSDLTLADDDIIGWRLVSDYSILPEFVPVDYRATDSATTISLSTPPTGLSFGSTFTVNLVINNAVDCAMWAVKNLTWDPSVIELTNIDEGTFLEGSTLFLNTPIETGVVEEITNSLSEAGSYSGSGVLAILTFEVVGYGDSNIVIAGYAVQVDPLSNEDFVQSISTTYNGIAAPAPTGPTAVITSPQNNKNVAMGSEITLDGSNSEAASDGVDPIAITAYTWSINGPSFSQTLNGANPGTVTLSNPGDYTFELTVNATGATPETDSVTHIVHVFNVSSDGAAVDLYTDRGGEFAMQNASAYGPQELVTIYANVTYNGAAVPGKDISFEIRDNEGNLVAVRGGTSDDNGVATVSYRIPWPSGNPEDSFGKWSIQTTVSFSQVDVTDVVYFTFDYILDAVEVSITNLIGNSITSVARSNQMKVLVSVSNIRDVAVNCLVCFTLVDEGSVPIQCVTVNLSADPGDTEETGTGTMITIPEWAFVGTATAYVNVLTNLPSLGGVPFCPEASMNFGITK